MLYAFNVNLFLFKGTMTDDHALYYGFSRFAIELNELNEEEARFLPQTDSRFRPDQRFIVFFL